MNVTMPCEASKDSPRRYICARASGARHHSVAALSTLTDTVIDGWSLPLRHLFTIQLGLVEFVTAIFLSHF
jgi:hypothetical protein